VVSTTGATFLNMLERFPSRHQRNVDGDRGILWGLAVGRHDGEGIDYEPELSVGWRQISISSICFAIITFLFIGHREGGEGESGLVVVGQFDPLPASPAFAGEGFNSGGGIGTAGLAVVQLRASGSSCVLWVRAGRWPVPRRARTMDRPVVRR
jgi:hypothetical protein